MHGWAICLNLGRASLAASIFSFVALVFLPEVVKQACYFHLKHNTIFLHIWESIVFFLEVFKVSPFLGIEFLFSVIPHLSCCSTHWGP